MRGTRRINRPDILHLSNKPCDVDIDDYRRLKKIKMLSKWFNSSAIAAVGALIVAVISSTLVVLGSKTALLKKGALDVVSS